uniref:Portal n=1 Tax=Siphoviridae sp. ctLfk13 TaxID=2826251 RepID=A0A8S5N262_9CAUD|nr:MAG TPA: portal [Siphoviridae sp. ctLfk13]
MKYEQRFQEALGAFSRSLASLRQEDIGWLPLSAVEGADSLITLDVIRDHSARARRLATLNPIVKRGLVVRNAYMWGDPVVYKGSTGPSRKVIEENTKACFSVQARVRDEQSFNTDGCVIYLVDKATKTVSPVPLMRLAGVATDDATGDVVAVLINPVVSGEPQWYMLWDRVGVKITKSNYKVNKRLTVVYATVNRLAAEQYGKPDLMSAMSYAQKYKEHLEVAHLMEKSLAKLAFKATSVNSKQQQAVQQRMAGPGVGATANIGAGQDIQAINKAGAGIDFSAGTPLAAMVSAALDIPLSVLLTDGSAGGRQGAETALEDPTFKALELRRQLHIDMLNEIAAALGIKVSIEYGSINNDQTHRRIQSLTLAYQNGALHQIEMRSGVLQLLKIAGSLPLEDLPALPDEGENEDEGEEDSTTTKSDDAEDGRATGVGPMSDGTNDNRDRGTDA